MVPTFQEEILKDLSCGISHDVNLTGPHPALPGRTPSTEFPLPLSQRNLLRTVIVVIEAGFYGWMPFLTPTCS